MSIPSIQGEEQKPLRRMHRRDLLRREIILTLVVKVVVIYALWYAFFSHPIDDTLTGSQVGNVLLGNPQPESAPLPENEQIQKIPGL